MQTSLLGKIFYTTLGAWLVGKTTNTLIRGTQTEIEKIANAMLASKKFQMELQKPGATVASVIEKLNLKHASVLEFERTLGIRWPLAIPMLISIHNVIVHFFSTYSM